MKVEILKDFQGFIPGQIRDLNGGIADMLIVRGIARPVVQAAEKPANNDGEQDADEQPKPKKKAK